MSFLFFFFFCKHGNIQFFPSLLVQIHSIRPRFCGLSCTHATPDRHSQDHTHSSNIYVIFTYLYAILSSWKKVGLFCAWRHTESFSNIYFSNFLCVLNVTRRSCTFLLFSKSLFSKQCTLYLKTKLLVAT